MVAHEREAGSSMLRQEPHGTPRRLVVTLLTVGGELASMRIGVTSPTTSNGIRRDRPPVVVTSKT